MSGEMPVAPFRPHLVGEADGGDPLALLDDLIADRYRAQAEATAVFEVRRAALRTKGWSSEMLGRAMREAASDEQALSVVLHQQIRSLQALRRTIVGANVLQHDARHLFFLLRDQVRFLERSSNGLPVVRQ